MNRKIIRSLVAAAFVFVFALNFFAQERPFKAGETLTYEAKFSKVIKSLSVLSVAELSFAVANAPNNKDLLIKSEAVSKGTLIKLFRYSFLQQIDSTVSGSGNFRILESVKHDVQKERVRDSVAVFDYPNKTVTYIENDPKDASRPPRKIASAIVNPTQDLISGIYTLRLSPLAVGQTFDVPVSDSGLVYNISVRVTSRELQKTAVGKLWCFRLEPDVFGANKFIEKGGSLVLWISDDARRLPVRTQINSDFGRVEIKIKTAVEGR